MTWFITGRISAEKSDTRHVASRSQAHFNPPSSGQAKRLKVINNAWLGIESVETHCHHRVGLPELVRQGVAHCPRRSERMPAGRFAPQPLQRWCHFVLFGLGTRRQGAAQAIRRGCPNREGSRDARWHRLLGRRLWPNTARWVAPDGCDGECWLCLDILL